MFKFIKLINLINNIFLPYILIFLINLYRFVRKGFPKTCRFYPSCSQYSIDAFKKKGFIYGVFLTIKRLLKCHPFSKGGIDFVE